MEALRRVLDAKAVTLVLDWGPLVLFYALDGSVPFLVTAGSALALALICIALTHVRSLLNPTIASPKILDLGFVSTFGIFVAMCAFGTDVAKAVDVWANALMNAALTMIVLVGVAYDKPFVQPFYIEQGMPVQMATSPYMIVVLNRSALQYAAAFGAMSLVCVVPAGYRCLWLGGCLPAF